MSDQLRNRIIRLSVIGILLSLTIPVNAQHTKTIHDGYTPTGAQPGAPAGSYVLSNFDNINMFNGTLNFRLPLLTIGGRGAAGYTMTLPIEKHWRINRTYYGPDSQTHDDEAHYESGNTAYVGYSPGVLIRRHAADKEVSSFDCSNPPYVYLLTRLNFISPDGTEYQLHDKAYQGAARGVQFICNRPPVTTNRGRVFVTADGESMTFVSDQDIFDATPGFPPPGLTGNLMMRDGTVYRIEDGEVKHIRDRNGNRVSFTYRNYSRA